MILLQRPFLKVSKKSTFAIFERLKLKILILPHLVKF
jgi:hypothetical protein